MVYLDGSPIDELRLGAAERLANMFGAYVTGLFINILPDIVAPTKPAAPAPTSQRRCKTRPVKLATKPKRS